MEEKRAAVTEQEPQANGVQPLILALIKAKRAFKPVVKDATNPHFRSAYATLSAYLDATQDALLTNGLAVVQAPMMKGEQLVLTTVILHASGASLQCGEYPVFPPKQDPQGYASAMTYARRISYSTALGLAAEDDDGNAANKDNGKVEPVIGKTEPVISEAQRALLFARARKQWPDVFDRVLDVRLHEIAKAVGRVESLTEIPQSRFDAVLRAIGPAAKEEF